MSRRIGNAVQTNMVDMAGARQMLLAEDNIFLFANTSGELCEENAPAGSIPIRGSKLYTFKTPYEIGKRKYWSIVDVRAFGETYRKSPPKTTSSRFGPPPGDDWIPALDHLKSLSPNMTPSYLNASGQILEIVFGDTVVRRFNGRGPHGYQYYMHMPSYNKIAAFVSVLVGEHPNDADAILAAAPIPVPHIQSNGKAPVCTMEDMQAAALGTTPYECDRFIKILLRKTDEQLCH